MTARSESFSHVLKNGKYLSLADALKPENVFHPTAAGKGLQPDLEFSKYVHLGFPMGEGGAGEGLTVSLKVEAKN